jgi:hypothetical protein
MVDRSREWDAASEGNGSGSDARRATLVRLQDLLGQRVYVVNLIRDIHEVSGRVA